MRRYLMLLCLLAAVLLAGCGAHTTTVTRATTTTTVAPISKAGPALTCDPTNVTMNCVLATQPPPPKTYSLAPGSTYGIDFGWSGVSAAGAKRIGAKFAASYFDHFSSKDWTRGLVSSYHAAGLQTVGVYESSAQRAEEGPLAGAADATSARSEAASVGNTKDNVDFAIDCGCPGAAIAGYFRGVHTVIGDRAGAYGGYDQLHYLIYSMSPSPVGRLNWQTYAWSGGRWLPASVAPLEQYLNGNAFDNDKALAANYGQSPAPQTVDPRHWDWLPNTRRTLRIKAYSPAWGAPRTIHARERATIQTWDKHGCRYPVRRAVCESSRGHMLLLAGRVYFIAHHNAQRTRVLAHPRWGAGVKVDGREVTLGGRYQQFARRLSSPGIVKAW